MDEIPGLVAPAVKNCTFATFHIFMRLCMQAANVLRKQHHIHVKGSSVPPPLQVMRKSNSRVFSCVLMRIHVF